MRVIGKYGSSVATMLTALAIGLGVLEPADMGARIARGVGMLGLLLLALAQFLGQRKQDADGEK